MCGCASRYVDLPSHTEAHGPKLELAIFLVFCYVPFLLADGVGLSGIVAILFTGLTMKRCLKVFDCLCIQGIPSTICLKQLVIW